MVINVIVIKVTTINVIIMVVMMLEESTTLSFAGSIWWKLQEVDHTGPRGCTNGEDLMMMLMMLMMTMTMMLMVLMMVMMMMMTRMTIMAKMMTMRVMQIIIIMWMDNHDCDDLQSHNHNGGDLYQYQYWRSYLVRYYS